jgi:hypothetical protein
MAFPLLSSVEAIGIGCSWAVSTKAWARLFECVKKQHAIRSQQMRAGVTAAAQTVG